MTNIIVGICLKYETKATEWLNLWEIRKKKKILKAKHFSSVPQSLRYHREN